MHPAELLRKVSAGRHESLAKARRAVEPDPSPAQAAAGNYAKGHVQIHGMDISLENSKGGTRRGVDPDGTPWESEMKHDYGYFSAVDKTVSVQKLDQPVAADIELSRDGSDFIAALQPAAEFDDIQRKLVAGVRVITKAARLENSSRVGSADSEASRCSLATQTGPYEFLQFLQAPGERTLTGFDILFTEVAADYTAVHAHILGDLRVGQTLRKEGFSSLDVKDRSMVQAHVRRLGEDLKVFQAVIQLVPVKVVNVLVGKEATTDSILDDLPVLLDVVLAAFDDAVKIGGFLHAVAASLPVAFAASVAERVSAAQRKIRSSGNSFPTPVTVSVDPHGSQRIRKSPIGKDGDAVDCFIGDDPESELVVAIDQFKGKVFDETKFMLGFLTRDQAIAGYLKHYPKGWDLGPVSTCTVSQLKEWLKDGDTKKPFGGQKVKTAGIMSEAGRERRKEREKRWDSWVGFDLDGTLAMKQEPFNKDTVGEPIEPMMKVLRKHLDDGDTCKIFTARAFSPGATEVVQRWLEEQNIPKLEVTNIKDPGMTILYDDRAVSVKSDVGTTKKADSKNTCPGCRSVATWPSEDDKPTEELCYRCAETKSAGQIVRRVKMVEEIHEHCPHCDHEFREKGGPRPSDYDACRESRYEDYDMQCPNCKGVIEDEEPSDEEIEKIRQSPDGLMGGAWLADYRLRKREAQRKRRAMRQDVLKSAAPKKGCLMLEVPYSMRRDAQKWIKRNIPEDEWAAEGAERDTHVTILYGFPPTVSMADLKKSKHWPSGPIEIALGDVKRFKADKRRPESDVIVVEVHSEELSKLHHAFKEEFGVTTNYPTYNAHLTLAYVKPGALKDLDGEHFMGGRWVTCDEVCYAISHDDGHRDRETTSIGSKELAKAASVEHATLGFSKSAAAVAEAPVIPRTGSAAIMHALSRMNLDDLAAQARDDIRSKKKTRRPRAVKILNIVEGLRRNELTPTDMMIKKVPVIPPNFRPFNVIGDTLLPGDANELYKDLIDQITMFKKTRDVLGDEGARDSFKAMVQAVRAVHGYADSPNPKSVARGVSGFLEKVTGTSPKTSFIQRNLLSKPQDSVARGVIVPDPELTLDEIGVPEESAWRMYGDYVQRNLVKSGMSPMDAFKHRIDRTSMARKALLRELEVRPVQYSRSPAWHEQNFVAGRPKLVSGDAITISPLVAAGMNADYDGDNMNLHVPASDEAVTEAYEKLLPSRMLWSVRDPQNRILPVPKHEMVSQLHASNMAASKRAHRFDTEELALAAIKAGTVDLSDEVEIGPPIPPPTPTLGAPVQSATMPPVAA